MTKFLFTLMILKVNGQSFMINVIAGFPAPLLDPI